MDLSGLTEHLAAVEDDAALELPIGGRTYRVRPPSAAVGARCVALWASRTIEDPAERARAVEDALGGTLVHVLTLGADVVEQMTADGVPDVVVRECGTVALVAWALGPAAAQRYVDRMGERRTEAGGASGEARPASRRRRKSGTPTGSARKTP